MRKKYKLTDETKVIDGHTLHRIRACKDFGNVKAGDLGGWVESEKNLSQEGNCWVYDNAVVFENAEVRGNARVYDYALVRGHAEVFKSAKVYGISKVIENAKVTGKAKVFDHASVYGNAQVFGYAWVQGHSEVYGDAKVNGNARVSGNTEVCCEEEENDESKEHAADDNLWSKIPEDVKELMKKSSEMRKKKKADNDQEPTALACSDFPTREEIDELDRIGLAGVMKKHEQQERRNAIWFWIMVSLISVCGGVVGTVFYRWLQG